jgi:hypothetical protein
MEVFSGVVYQSLCFVENQSHALLGSGQLFKGSFQLGVCWWRKFKTPLKKQTLLLDGLFILKKRERSSLLYLSSMVAGPFATCKLL